MEVDTDCTASRSHESMGASLSNRRTLRWSIRGTMFKLFLAVVGAITTSVAADVPDRWIATIKTGGSLVDLFLTLNRQGEVVTGTIAYEDEAKQSPIENVAVSGNQLTFEAHDNANQVVAFRLIVAADSLSGQVTSGGQATKVTFRLPPPPGVYRVRGGVTAPTLAHKVEPAYSKQARQKRIEGTVLLYIQVDPSGRAINMRVLHSLGGGLNEKAMEAVRKWKFNPGMKDGKPVTVEAQVEVNFRLR
jgi:TonB family protein